MLGLKKEKKFSVQLLRDNIVLSTLSEMETDEDVALLEKWAGQVKEFVLNEYLRQNQKLLSLVDASHVNVYKARAFEILSDLLRTNDPYIEKTATFGASRTVRMAQDTLSALSGRQMKAFSKKDEALEWLTGGAEIKG